MLRSHRFVIVTFWAILATLLLHNTAHAYVGPGAGMEFVGYAMSLLAMMGLAFFSILMWPVYALLRWIRGPKTIATPPASTAPLAETTVSSPAIATPADVHPIPSAQS